jgi:hypothetical protein
MRSHVSNSRASSAYLCELSSDENGCAQDLDAQIGVVVGHALLDRVAGSVVRLPVQGWLAGWCGDYDPGRLSFMEDRMA